MFETRRTNEFLVGRIEDYRCEPVVAGAGPCTTCSCAYYIGNPHEPGCHRAGCGHSYAEHKNI
jgi:hypothetical protein